MSYSAVTPTLGINYPTVTPIRREAVMAVLPMPIAMVLVAMSIAMISMTHAVVLFFGRVRGTFGAVERFGAFVYQEAALRRSS